MITTQEQSSCDILALRASTQGFIESLAHRNAAVDCVVVGSSMLLPVLVQHPAPSPHATLHPAPPQHPPRRPHTHGNTPFHTEWLKQGGYLTAAKIALPVAHSKPTQQPCHTTHEHSKNLQHQCRKQQSHKPAKDTHTHAHMRQLTKAKHAIKMACIPGPHSLQPSAQPAMAATPMPFNYNTHASCSSQRQHTCRSQLQVSGSIPLNPTQAPTTHPPPHLPVPLHPVPATAPISNTDAVVREREGAALHRPASGAQQHMLQ